MKYTIVTINYNNGNEIGRTIESIYNQTCTDYEYIIVDGLSKDNSIKIAESYIDKFDNKGIKYTIISEKDNGIFDAMNKGIDLAQGDYINFMNSGDCFSDNKVLENCYNDMVDCDVYYGDAYMSHNNKIVDYSYANTMETIETGTPFCHQASFTRTTVAKEYKFNSKRLSGDYDFFLRLYLANKKFKQVYSFLAIFDNTGISSRQNGDRDIVRQECGLKPVKVSKIKRFVRKLVPKCLITWRHKRMRKRQGK